MDQDQEVDFSEISRANSVKQEDFTLRWAEVNGIAKELFRVWSDGSEREWAEVAWGHIIAVGYANGEHGKEYCRARLRFLALATLYADWCSIATEEEPEPEVYCYIETLKLNPFYLGLLLGPDYELDGQDRFDFYDDEIALANAVLELVDKERPIVAEALLAGFGSPGGLFVSLWRTQYPMIEQRDELEENATPVTKAETPSNEVEAASGRQLQLLTELSDFEDDDEDNEYDEDDEQDEAALSDEEILNDVTAEKVGAWEWINEGCPSLN